MTMPSSGPLSIGQARNEMSQGNPINAGNGGVSQLAGVSPGQRYAWSYWRGKSKPFPYQPVVRMQITVDRQLYVYYNMRTGGGGIYSTDGDRRTSLQALTPYIGPQAGLSGLLVASIPGGQQLVMVSGVDENGMTYTVPANRGIDFVQIAQHPRAENDWTLIVYFNDDSGYSSGGCFVDVYVGS